MSHTSGIIYKLEDVPEFPKNLTLALQHVLTMFGATVIVPLWLGPEMGMSPENIAILVSSVMLCSGVATLMQVLLGSRLPIIQGVSFSFITPFLLIIAYAENNPIDGDPGATAMRYIAGAVMVGALFEVGIGFSGLMGWMRRFLSPVVVGPVIMLIGLALFEHGAPKAGTDWLTSGLTMMAILAFSQILSRHYQAFRIFPILLAIVLAYSFALVATQLGYFGPGHPSHINLGLVGQAPWLRLNPAQLIFPWGTPLFDPVFWSPFWPATWPR